MTLRIMLIAWNAQERGFWEVFVTINHGLTYNGHSNFDGPLHMYTNPKKRDHITQCTQYREARLVERTTGITDERILNFNAMDWKKCTGRCLNEMYF